MEALAIVEDPLLRSLFESSNSIHTLSLMFTAQLLFSNECLKGNVG